MVKFTKDKSRGAMDKTREPESKKKVKDTAEGYTTAHQQV
jgi:hypothetical protein